MTFRSLRCAALVVLVGAGLAACGDDDGSDRPGPPDAGSDAGGGNVDGGGPSDGGTDGGSDTRMCMPAGGACDVRRQNCPTATDGCYFGRAEGSTTDSTVCAPAGTAGAGEACEAPNNCLPGLTCSSGVCRTYCCEGRSSDCPSGAGQTCVGFLGGEPLGVCVPSTSCSLVPNAGCTTAGQSCYSFGDDGTLGCFEPGTLTEGANCTGMGFNSCAPGHGCYSMDGTNFTCIKFCRIDQGETDCAAGRACATVSGLPLPSNIGLCPAS